MLVAGAVDTCQEQFNIKKNCQTRISTCCLARLAPLHVLPNTKNNAAGEGEILQPAQNPKESRRENKKRTRARIGMLYVLATWYGAIMLQHALSLLVQSEWTAGLSESLLNAARNANNREGITCVQVTNTLLLARCHSRNTPTEGARNYCSNAQETCSQAFFHTCSIFRRLLLLLSFLVCRNCMELQKLETPQHC